MIAPQVFFPRFIFCLVLLCLTKVNAEAPSTAEGLGFSAPRLAALSAMMEKDVAEARLPGAVLLVARDGKMVLSSAVGAQNPITKTPMRADSIFRIYSMTKPIVSVAVMMLVEEGKILLTDPISKYLPELKNLQVGIEKTDAAGVKALERAPALREITIQDLLRHTSGLTYGFEGSSLVKDEYKKFGIDSATESPTAWLEKLAKVPLASQPGTRWEYSVSTDVLGVLLERVSGQSLDVLLADKIFRPLNMPDTAFTVSAEKYARMAEPFEIDPVWKRKFAGFDARKTPLRLSGGGGLVSTANDYLRFLQMLLNGGALDGARILAPKTVELMLADHLAPLRLAAPNQAVLGPRPAYGFGLGFAVRTEQGGANTLGTIGIGDWSGLGGTIFWIDPKEKLAVVWMAQAPGMRSHYRQVLANRVYAALVR